MVRHSMFVVVGSLVGILLAAPAFADIAPPDSCVEADAGKACTNASSSGKMDQPGKCQKDKCTRATPTGSVSYDCYLCKAAKADPGGDCSTSGRTGQATIALVPLLALGVLWSRRRRANAR